MKLNGQMTPFRSALQYRMRSLIGHSERSEESASQQLFTRDQGFDTLDSLKN